MDQKLTFLKREDIRTMAKDLARLQEEEAAKEKERISRLETEEKTRKYAGEKERLIDTFIPKKSEVQKEIPEPIPLPPKTKPSILQKIFVRIIIILSFFGILFLIGFGYWNIFVNKKSIPETTPAPSPSESISPLVPPIPIFPVKEIKILDIGSSGNDLKTALNKISEDITETGFYELIVRKNETSFKISELLKEFKILYPENLFEAVSDETKDFDFLFYKNDRGTKRYALIAKINGEEKINGVLASWEALISNTGISLFDEKFATIYPGFKTLNYKNATIRFLTISKADLGACHAIVDNYLVFSTSLEAIKKIVDSNIMKTDNTI